MSVPNLITLAVVSKNLKVLLVRNNSEYYPDKWALPGGAYGFRNHSDPRTAMCDQMVYDLNVEFRIEYFYKHFYFRDKSGPTLAMVYSGQLLGEPMLNQASLRDWGWFGDEELDGLDLAPGHSEILDDYLF